MAIDKMRKKYQRQFNKKLKELNKSCENDELWRGRFLFLQRKSDWWRFEDGSGGELTVFIRAIDKKTNYYKDYRLEYTPWMSTFNWHLSMDVANDFIVEAVDVWREEPRPSRKNAPDFTNVKVDIKGIMAQPWNFYIAQKHFDKAMDNGYFEYV